MSHPELVKREEMVLHLLFFSRFLFLHLSCAFIKRVFTEVNIKKNFQANALLKSTLGK